MRQGDAAANRSAGRSRQALIAAACAVALLGWAASAVIDHPPLYDELAHFLAAQGLDSGRPQIAHGEYTRALAFTKLVALAIERFGSNLIAARLPALLAAAMLAALLAFWVTLRAGLRSGLLAGLLLCLVPMTVELAVFARFYTVHALLICLIAVASYESIHTSRARWVRALLAIFAAVLVPIAWHFQSSTLIAAGAIACATAAVLVTDRWLEIKLFVARRPLLITAAVFCVAAVGLTLFWMLDVAARMREVPLWAAWTTGRPYYYFVDLAENMPLLWPMFPVAAVLATTRHRRLSLFCIVLFTTALAVHSVAAAKSSRYLYYALPFFCVVWACAVSAAFELLRAIWTRSASVLSIAAISALMLTQSQEGQRLARLLLRTPGAADSLSFAGEADWTPVLATLRSQLAASDRVVTSNSMKAIYYLGRYDYELNASIVAETDTRTDFGVDERTGGLAIGSAAAMRRVLEMPGASLVILEEKKLGIATGVSDEALMAIRSRCAEIDLPRGIGLHAWRCTQQRT